MEPWPGRGHPGRQCGGTHWGQTMCQFWVTAPSCHAGHNCSSSPQKHREEPQQYFIQGASGASRHGDMDLVCAVSHGTRLVPGQLVWPQGQHPEVPQSPPQRRYPVAWSPPWHSSSSPSAFSAIQPTYGPFSTNTTTVFKEKSGTNSTAAWPTALLVLTQRIYI